MWMTWMKNVDCDLDQLADDSTVHTISLSVDDVLTDLKKILTNSRIMPSETLWQSIWTGVISWLSQRRNFLAHSSKLNFAASKYLGVTLDDDLKWDHHVQKICKTFSQKVKKQYQMKKMPKSALLLIYFQGILPSVLYGIILWDNCSLLL